MTSSPHVIRADSDVTIRYWASARAVAGCDSERFTGRHVRDVLEAASAAHAGLATARFIASFATWAPRAVGGVPASAPPKVPMAVRAPSRMTTSRGMGVSPLLRVREGLAQAARAAKRHAPFQTTRPWAETS